MQASISTLLSSSPFREPGLEPEKSEIWELISTRPSERGIWELTDVESEN